MNSFKKFSTALLASAMVFAGASGAAADEPELTNYDDTLISFEASTLDVEDEFAEDTDGDFDNETEDSSPITRRRDRTAEVESDANVAEGDAAEIAPLDATMGDADLAVTGAWLSPVEGNQPDGFLEPGEAFQIRVVVRNYGEDEAQNPWLHVTSQVGGAGEEPASASLNFTRAEPEHLLGGTPCSTDFATEVRCAWPSLQAGATMSILIDGTVTENRDDLANGWEGVDGYFGVWFANTGADNDDPNEANNVYTDWVRVDPGTDPIPEEERADLAVTGEWVSFDPAASDDGMVEPGTLFTADVTITNQGPDTAINPVLNIEAMGGNSLEITSAHQVVYEAMGGDCPINDNQVACMPPSDELAPGESATFRIGGEIATDSADLVEDLFDMDGFFAGLNATVTADNVIDDDVAGLDDIWQGYVQVNVGAEEGADLAVTGEWISFEPAQDDAGMVEPGTLFVVDVTITNQGPDTAINPVLLVEAMGDDSLEFTSAHEVAYEAMGADCPIIYNEVSCMLDELAPGESATFRIGGEVTSDTAALVEDLFDMDGFFAGITASVSADNAITEDIFGLDDIWQGYVQVAVTQPGPTPPTPTPTKPKPGCPGHNRPSTCPSNQPSHNRPTKPQRPDATKPSHSRPDATKPGHNVGHHPVTGVGTLGLALGAGLLTAAGSTALFGRRKNRDA